MGLPASTRRPAMVMHTLVDQPVADLLPGRITCHAIGREPVVFTWVGPTTEPVATSADGTEAINVVPGVYRVSAVDADGERAEQLVRVEPLAPHTVCITGYLTTAASSSVARDGAVEALGRGLERCALLWTNGVRTSGPVLHDVPAGIYAALPVDEVSPYTVVHSCAPARVTVRA